MAENEALKIEKGGTGSNSRAVGCFLTKQYQKALAEYKDLLASDPSNIAWLSNIVLCLTEMNQIDETVFGPFLERIDEFSTEALFCYEDALEYFGHTDDALTVLDEILERDDTNITAWVIKAELLEALGEGDEVLALLKSIFPRFKKDERVLCLVAGYASKAGNVKQADYLFKKALKINRPYTLQSIYFYEHLISAGREKKAVQYAKEALETQPDNENVLESYAVANALSGDYDEADETFEKLQKLSSELPDRIKVLWADALLGKKDFAKAFDIVETISRDYVFKESLFLFQRKVLYYMKFAGQDVSERAARWLREYPDNAIVQHTCAALRGDRDAPTPPLDFTREFFDLFADDFDEVLGQLEYTGPSRVKEILRQADLPEGESWTVLDAGCGTGLIGSVLRPYAAPEGKLVGVDASSRMLDQARTKVIYDALEQADLLEYLPQHPKEYTLISCMDVSPYVGDLQPLFNCFSKALSDDGWLVFSVLKAPAEENVSEYALMPSGQYFHALPYVEKCLQYADFEIDTTQQDVLRYEMGEALTGALYVVRKKR